MLTTLQLRQKMPNAGARLDAHLPYINPALNSGWQPWIPAFYASSALLGALALTIDRCDDGRPITILGALLARIAAALRRILPTL